MKEKKNSDTFALFVVAKLRKQSKQPSVQEQVNNPIHAPMEEELTGNSPSTTNKKKRTTATGRQRNFNKIMISEKCKFQKTACSILHLHTFSCTAVTVSKHPQPWLGGSVVWSVTVHREGCGFDPWSGHAHQATHRCFSLPPPAHFLSLCCHSVGPKINVRGHD